MNTSALIMLLAADITVTAFTVYFFMKVLKAGDKVEEDFPPSL